MSRDRPVAESDGSWGHHGVRANDFDRWVQERDRPLVEFMDAVETVRQFVGGDEGERIRQALLSLVRPKTTFDPTVNLPW